MYLLICMDQFSFRPEVIFLSDIMMETIAKVLVWHQIPHFGILLTSHKEDASLNQTCLQNWHFFVISWCTIAKHPVVNDMTYSTNSCSLSSELTTTAIGWNTHFLSFLEFIPRSEELTLYQLPGQIIIPVSLKNPSESMIIHVQPAICCSLFSEYHNACSIWYSTIVQISVWCDAIQDPYVRTFTSSTSFMTTTNKTGEIVHSAIMPFSSLCYLVMKFPMMNLIFSKSKCDFVSPTSVSNTSMHFRVAGEACLVMLWQNHYDGEWVIPLYLINEVGDCWCIFKEYRAG